MPRGLRLFTHLNNSNAAHTCTYKHTTQAVLQILTEPVNSTTPVAAEVLKAAGAYDPRRLMGVTTLDVVRASAIVARAYGLSGAGGGVGGAAVDVPVVGGRGGEAALPLLSQAAPPLELDPALQAAITRELQDADASVRCATR